MYVLVQPAPVFTGKVPVRLVFVLHAALPARARRGDGSRCFCEGFKGLRVKGAIPGVELSRLDLIERRGRGALAFFVFVASRDWTGGRVAHPAAALHAVIRCRRGEAAAQEPRSCPFVLGGAFRLRVVGGRALPAAGALVTSSFPRIMAVGGFFLGFG